MEGRNSGRYKRKDTPKLVHNPEKLLQVKIGMKLIIWIRIRILNFIASKVYHNFFKENEANYWITMYVKLSIKL